MGNSLRNSYQNSLPNYIAVNVFHRRFTLHVQSESPFLSCFWGPVFVLVGFCWCVFVFVSLFFHQEIHSNVVKDDLCTMQT